MNLTQWKIVFLFGLIAIINTNLFSSNKYFETDVLMQSDTVLPKEVIFESVGGTYQLGKEFCIDITTKNFTEIGSFFYILNWDTSIIEFQYFDFAGGILTGEDVNIPEAYPNYIFTLFVNRNGYKSLPDDAKLVTLCFKAKKIGQTKMSFSEDPRPVKIPMEVSGKDENNRPKLLSLITLESDIVITDNLNTCEPDNMVFECVGVSANKAAVEEWHQRNIEKLKANCIGRDSGMIIVSTTGISGASFNCGACTINGYYEVIDTVGGVTFDRKQAIFEIVDNTPPVFLDSTHDTIECTFRDPIFGWRESVQNNSSVYDCSITSSISFRSSELIEQNEKSTTYKYVITLTDAHRNVGFQDVFLTILDTTPPIITCNPIDFSIECSGNENNEAQATQWNVENIIRLENCSREYCSDVFVTSDFDATEVNSNCELVVTYSITDEFNNVSTRTATLMIMDTTPPLINCNLGGKTVLECTQQYPIKPRLIEYHNQNLLLLEDCFSDDCGNFEITHDFDTTLFRDDCLSGPVDLAVNYFVTDNCGNTTSVTRQYNIIYRGMVDELCTNLTIKGTNNQLVISPLAAPITIAKVYNQQYELVYECNINFICPETVTIPNLTEGETYFTDIQFFSEDFTFICQDKQEVIIEGGDEPCDTSICQGDVILRTQTDVDAFCGCEVIEGDLRISGMEVDNLLNLQSIKTVKGFVSVSSTRVQNLDGLNNLKRIGETLFIGNNPSIENLLGLNNLRFITISLVIDANERLRNLQGIDQLESVKLVTIASNPSLVSIQALNSPDSLNSISITDNDKLLNLDGFDEITSLADGNILGGNFSSLVVGGNEALTSLAALKNIMLIEENVIISSNSNLDDCCGIAHLIDNNPDNGMIIGRISIDNNLMNCNSIETVLTNCQILPLVCQNIQILTDNNQITIQGLTAPNEIIKVFDNNFNILYECAGNCEETQVAGTFPAGNYTVDIQLYDENWQQICAEQRPITLAGVTVGDCAMIEATTNNQQITVSGLVSAKEKVTITALPENRSGNISTTTFYKLEGDFTLMEMGGQLILDFAENYRAEDSLPGLYLYLTNDPDSMDDALEIGMVETFEGQHSYEIEGVDLNQYDYLLYYCKPFRVKVGEGKINTTQQVIFECTNDCGDVITTEKLPVGTYQIDVAFFDQEGGAVCDYQQNITLASELPCQDINITTLSNRKELVISTPSVPNAIIKIFDANWQIIYDCTASCENELAIPISEEGIYHTDVQFYDENWVFICEDKQDVEVVDEREPCNTSICQGNVFLRTQAEVDAFCGCAVIEGDLIIGNVVEKELTDIINLNTLSNIKRIKGGLVISRTQVEDFRGLSNLEFIDIDLYVADNKLLTDFQGLPRLKRADDILIMNNESLERIDGFKSLDVNRRPNIRIENNHSLKSILAFDNFTELSVLHIDSCSLLQDLSGFKNLERITDFLYLLDNNSLQTLDDFSNLQFVGNDFFLLNNLNLYSIKALNNLTTIGDKLSIYGNEKLLSLEGIDNLFKVGRLFIARNLNLSDCCTVKHLIDGDLTNGEVAGEIDIADNTNSCDSRVDIFNSCDRIMKEELCDNLELYIAENNLTIANLNAPIQIVKVFDHNYATVYECFAECEATINLSDLAVGKYHVNIDFYNENWQPICNKVETVQIEASTQNRSVELLPEDFGLFPNPAQTETSIDLKKLQGEAVQLALYNQFGQLVQEQKVEKVEKAKLDLSALQNGLYILKIEMKHRKAIAKKLIVNRLY